MKASELRDKTREELIRQLKELQEEHFNLRFQKSVKLIKNPSRLSQIKKEIARIKTVLQEDKLEIHKVAH